MPKLCFYCFSPKIVRFQNGSNKVAIEPRGVQFWSEIILAISNRTSAEISPMISDQIALQTVQLPLLGSRPQLSMAYRLLEMLVERECSSNTPSALSSL